MGPGRSSSENGEGQLMDHCRIETTTAASQTEPKVAHYRILMTARMACAFSGGV